MSKNLPFRGKPKKAKLPNNPSGMLSQVQRMQQEMKETQDALANETVTVTAGGGGITIVITGHQRVQSITIAKELLDPDDPEMLQDILVAAVNQAIEQSQTMSAERLEKITGGVDLGGFGSLLGGM